MGSLLRIMFDYNIYEPSAVWLPLLIAGAPITIIFLYTGAKAFAGNKRKPASQLVLGIVMLLYSFTLIIFTNCHYNASQPQVFTVHVKGKHSERDKVTTYHLTLDAWGRFTTEQDEEVKAALYEKVQPDGQGHVFLLTGKWHIPWYVITE